MNGFNNNFLGNNYKVNFPTLNENLLNNSLNNGEIFDFTHFSLSMNKKMRTAIYVASNVDMSNLITISESRNYHFDSRIGEENQLGNEFYKNHGNGYDYDKGHLARRADLLWKNEKEAKDAQYDSCCYANISLQHPIFHSNPWSKLENWILSNTPKDILSKKLSIFAGPFYEDYTIGNSSDFKSYIPSGFWKVIFYIDTNNTLKSASFIMYQNQYLPRGSLKDLSPLKTYQVNLEKISDYTDLKFDDSLYATDISNTPKSKTSSNLIEGEKDLIL